MIKVQNITAHLIIIGAALFPIAPMAIAEVDGEDGGVKDMLAQGKLVIVGGEAASDTPPKTTPRTVEELKEALTNAGVHFDPAAKKADLEKLWADYEHNGHEV